MADIHTQHTDTIKEPILKELIKIVKKIKLESDRRATYRTHSPSRNPDPVLELRN